MRRNVAASMKPAPRPRKYFRNASFQWRRATTTSPPATFAAAAAEPKRRLQARADLMVAQHDSTRQGGPSREAYNILLGHSMLWVLVLSATVPGPPVAAQAPIAPEAPLVRDVAEAAVPPPPGAATITLAEAVATALKQNFNVLTAADGVASSRMQETVARSQFFPKLTPTYGQNVYGPSFDLDVRQKLPYTGATLSAEAGFRS